MLSITGSLSTAYRMLEEMDRELDHTDTRLRALTTRVQTAIRKSGGQQRGRGRERERECVCVCGFCDLGDRNVCVGDVMEVECNHFLSFGK